jgi:drug/metabolite transporter (DMT)-like permease
MGRCEDRAALCQSDRLLDASVTRVILGTLFLFMFLVWLKASLRPAHTKWLILVGMLQTAAFTIFNTLALERGEPMMAQK